MVRPSKNMVNSDERGLEIEALRERLSEASLRINESLDLDTVLLVGSVKGGAKTCQRDGCRRSGLMR